ncbi:hypothetical protein GTW43_09940 [Streptomyces sp. SID5785]|uniref:hypothetical protein n=1 Tax=Streptomyces sp. SID5785 TaxID=2690309 RepID=UPI001361550F|nr:hypothetical protein [Streptomyces sp. SID5785]MZD05399.1 hypothetical protein [Streptomyces sp. SID5785]
MDIEFQAAESHPTARDENTRNDQVNYPIGAYAAVSTNGANLFFQCPTEAKKGDSLQSDTKYVKAALYSASAKLRSDGSADELMTILNSIARHVAAEAECTAVADLPEKLPKPITS